MSADVVTRAHFDATVGELKALLVPKCLRPVRAENTPEEIEVAREFKTQVHHLKAMLKTVRSVRPGTEKARVAKALEEHLSELTPEALGLVPVSEPVVEAKAS